MALIAEPNLECYFSYIHVRFDEQSFRFGNSDAIDIGFEITSISLLNGMGDTALVYSGKIGN